MPLLASLAMPSGDRVSMVISVGASGCALLSEAMGAGEADSEVGWPATAVPFLFKWVLMCLDRWSLRMKRLGHSGQENFFSPAKERCIGTEEEVNSREQKGSGQQMYENCLYVYAKHSTENVLHLKDFALPSTQAQKCSYITSSDFQTHRCGCACVAEAHPNG